MEKSSFLCEKINYKLSVMKTNIPFTGELLLIALTITCSVSLSAQDSIKKERQSLEAMAVSQTAVMADSLELTPEQLEKIKEINLNFVQKLQTAKEAKLSESEIKLLYKNRTDSVKQLLNEDQRKRWEERAIRKHQKNKRRRARMDGSKPRTERQKTR
jgi:hypothetical protein